MKAIYGYFDDPLQRKPKFDPGLGVPCPVCTQDLELPVKTISITVPRVNRDWSDRSYFYRTHKQCYDKLDAGGRTRLDGFLVDVIVSIRNAN